MANQNGLAGQNQALYSGMNGSFMPSAGHYSDMQTLMQNMETLSGWLEQNRQEWTQVQEGIARVERLQGRLAQHGQVPLLNGDTQPVDEGTLPPTVSQLQNALATANARIGSLERTYHDQQRLQQMYEDTLTDTTDRIRQYCFEQQNHIIALHEHYTMLLAQARSETIEAQLTHQAWQAGLQRVSERVRHAMSAREAEGMPWKQRIAALKEENRVLRAKAGWDPPVDSDDEDNDEYEGGASAITAARGRAAAAEAAIFDTRTDEGGGAGLAAAGEELRGRTVQNPPPRPQQPARSGQE